MDKAKQLTVTKLFRFNNKIQEITEDQPKGNQM